MYHRIEFTSPGVAELKPFDLPDPAPGQVQVRTCVTTISAGTERANLMGNPNVSGGRKATPGQGAPFPRILGYSGSGIVEKVGEGVTGFHVGDRVCTSWGVHAEKNNFNASRVHKLPDKVSFEEGALMHISTFPLAGIRKTHLELGECGMTTGLGILGLMSVMLMKAAGAYPVLASDPVPERREIALELGADMAFDPTDDDYEEQVRKATDGRMVNAAVEVTGNGPALDRLLDVMASFGRVALLGCTRESDFTIDYYHKVHYPGITLVGAHTNARPNLNSSEHWWTEWDDLEASLRLTAAGRLPMKKLIKETDSPSEATEVYRRLAQGKGFPVCVQFDWRKL